MKRLYTFIIAFVLLLSAGRSRSQAYTLLTDTIYISGITGPAGYFDSVVTGASIVGFSYKVIDCNFPADWQIMDRSGFCDNADCRFLPGYWPSGTSYNGSNPAHDTGMLSLFLDLTTAVTSGCYYVTVRISRYGFGYRYRGGDIYCLLYLVRLSECTRDKC